MREPMSTDPKRPEFSWRQLTPRERSFVKRSLLLAVALPIALVLFIPTLDLIGWVAGEIAFLLFLPLYVVLRLLYRWSQGGESLLGALSHDLRLGFPTVPVGKSVRHATWPVVTTSIIVVNCLAFFYGDPEVMAFRLDVPGDWYWSNFSSMFAHWDAEHLLINMIFLWIFGSALEGRIGWQRYFLFYVATGSASNLVSAAAWSLLGETMNWSAGASGAISGVMGMFMVRCYFSRVSVGVPILGLVSMALPVVLRVQVNAMVFVTLYFLVDLFGARESLIYVVDVDYWGHLGGYLAGLALAYRTGLFRDGMRERAVTGVAAPGAVLDHGKSRTELDSLIREEPGNVEARLARARQESRFGPTASSQADYLGVVRTLLSDDGQRAAEAFVECFRASPCSLPIAEQLALTPALSRVGERGIAAFALEHAATRDQEDPSLVAKSMLYEARLHREMGKADLTARLHDQILRRFPESEAAVLLRERRRGGREGGPS
jgi:membrane associated rhomboid family serine protease